MDVVVALTYICVCINKFVRELRTRILGAPSMPLGIIETVPQVPEVIKCSSYIGTVSRS